ncbi:MAG: acetolactate synthase large subunit [Desulfovibrionaceae bacterium]
MNAAEMFVKALENEGVRYVFGIPGEENLDLLEALRESSIRLVLTRHEQAAGFMAATVGRLTGKAGVCLSTLGPGATNLVTAVSYAYLGGWPALFITGQKPITKSKQARFQIIDVVRMMSPITKFTRQIVHAHNVPGLVREACRIAEQEKPGPVHLELPEDIASHVADGHPFPVIEHYRPNASTRAVEKAARIIENAKRPLLVIAAGADRENVGHELYNLLYKTGMYFCTTQMGKGVVDERHPCSLGTAALSDGDYLHCAISSADVIINVGHDVVEKPPFFMHDGSLTVIHVSQEPAPIDDVYFPQHEVVGDVAESIKQITARIGDCAGMDRDYFSRIKAEIDENVYHCPLEETVPMRPQNIVDIVRRALPEDGVLSLDNGMYKIWFARNYKAYEPKTVLLDNALASMGAGLPVAIAVKMLNPGRKVLAICGDGGFMMNSQELETAVRLGLDLVVLILRDDGYGMIKWKQGGMDLPVYGLDFGNPDFVDYARSYGAKGHRVKEPGDLARTLRACLGAPGVHLIDLPVDYSENEKVFLKELKEKTCIL